MNKLLLLMGLVLVLGACGNDEDAEPEQKDENDMSQAEWAEEHGDEFEGESESKSSDPMEVGNKNDEHDTLVDGATEYKVIERYVTDETDEDGFNTIDFDGYIFNFSLALVEDQNGEHSIAMFGESENTTDEVVQFNADIEVVTDQQDQTNTQQGFGKSKPNVKMKGYDILPLEYGEPGSFTATIEPPMTEVGDETYEDFDIEPIELEFTKE